MSLSSRHPVTTATCAIAFGTTVMIMGILWQVYSLRVYGLTPSAIYFMAAETATIIVWYGLRRQKRRENAAIAARANHQHQALLDGDIMRGTYGRHQPVFKLRDLT